MEGEATYVGERVLVTGGRAKRPLLEFELDGDDGAGSEVTLPVPREDELSIDVANVQLHELAGFVPSEVFVTVARHKVSIVLCANFGLKLC